MVGFYDPLIPRKSAISDQALIRNESGIPLPSIVEVSESGTCNRSCEFCPRSTPDYPDIKEFINADLVDKLTRQLNDAGFKGLFLFSGFVEPLLDKNIFDLVALVRENLPDSRIEMVTNGDVLNRDRLKRLFDNGLSTLLISVYDSKEDADRFEDLCLGAGLNSGQFEVRHRYLPPTQDFGITLSNRAGMMENTEFKIPPLASPSTHPCYYTHYTFFMDYLGDVLQCPHDWGKKYIVGNMKTQNFMDIWTGPRLSKARQRLNKGDRFYAPCDVCDVEGTLIGQKHVDAWAELDNPTTADTA
jgi:radical SAM protein with 4Fe4S-binding SPASM domain